MAKKHEFRYAVGEPSGRRSSVWKIWTHKSDVYIMTRMFGADAKVSIHASGECQFSATAQWMRKNPDKRNAQRHIARWLLPQTEPDSAGFVFRIQIPESELRQGDAAEDMSGVTWLAAPPQGKAAIAECYMTPVSGGDPALATSLPYPLLRSFPLVDGRWFVVLHGVDNVNSADLERARQQVLEQNPEIASTRKTYSVALFGTVNDTQGRLLVELRPFFDSDGVSITKKAAKRKNLWRWKQFAQP